MIPLLLPTDRGRNTKRADTDVSARFHFGALGTHVKRDALCVLAHSKACSKTAFTSSGKMPPSCTLRPSM